MAQQLLTQFQDHEESWTRADVILEKSTVPQTKVQEHKPGNLYTRSDVIDYYTVYCSANHGKVCANKVEHHGTR